MERYVNFNATASALTNVSNTRTEDSTASNAAVTPFKSNEEIDQRKPAIHTSLIT